VTGRIIGCAFRVADTRGHGFIKKVYENAVAHEMRKSGLGVVQQRGIVVFYDGMIVGEYTSDLIVEDEVIVERKVCPRPERRASPAMPDLLAGDRQAPSPFWAC
jgi:GxxExxY protein